MELTSQQIVFFILAAVILVCSVLTVTTRRILRAATYLLFVLFATDVYKRQAMPRLPVYGCGRLPLP